MFAGSTTSESLALMSQKVLSRVVVQERENVLLQGDVRLREEEAQRAAEEERAAFAELEASVQEVVRLCLSCATSVQDEAVMDAVVQQLTQQIGEEEAAAQSFALEVQHERVALLARRAAVADEKTAEEDDAFRQEHCERVVDEEEGRRERLEIMRVEQDRLDLERRTELSTLRYARELFHVNTE
ncbi:hypothetical protein TcCL_NonESM01872 [Trypanosoma cruzi]|uniref:Uncharacterized protein n=1 Tax=Trypanosoma cruzi (strain CL Brener) TaxID=353153 RepID=Q4DAN3_TRYCC|nr:hypothetical protein, conserved [Trypanosoma cruzi]EAN89577.1 hypothetical protein, conserved [Trypanosoma cruzi]RNC48275.1 hypothetical protein TcCL_NonESM01872 [Trypanosoma cruzi]|eukprot:XP_811428.1 hypothetical protein [Trypanosoma cruzi strain CL Brener]